MEPPGGRVGRNPGRILSLLRQFADRHRDQKPLHRGRTDPGRRHRGGGPGGDPPRGARQSGVRPTGRPSCAPTTPPCRNGCWRRRTAGTPSSATGTATGTAPATGTDVHRNHGFVTLAYGHLTPVAGGLAVDLVRAGHTPPLLLDADHAVATVEAPGGLLGIGMPPGLASVRFTLRRTESLVLCTDGITECRAEGTDE
ncbi:SpoIIE family protein phosphatase [Streptomyces racemochromogenes]|uniref:SpoIIE family protein phosphatase n=1 Tax=Streptomyces racemochromogenes TaxID=67353 RepID=A0ABW7PG55_9ACTN